MFRDLIWWLGEAFKIYRTKSIACWLNLFWAKFILSTDSKSLKCLSMKESSSLFLISFSVFTLDERATAFKIFYNWSFFSSAPVKSTVSVLLFLMLLRRAWYLDTDSLCLGLLTTDFWVWLELLREEEDRVTLRVLALGNTWEKFTFLIS